MAMEIENIEAARLREGIDDADLRDHICALTAEDHIRVSISGDGAHFEKVSVRITSRKGTKFRGKLLNKPRQTSLRSLRIGSPVLFDGNQIHSIVNCKNAPAESSVICFVTTPKKDDTDIPATSTFVRSVPRVVPNTIGQATNNRLLIQGEERRRFIQVPIGIAQEFYQYLRSRRVRATPPQPYLNDSDRIELDRSIDVSAVQSVLDAWPPPS